MNIDLAGHLSWLLHVDIVVEKVLESWDFAERLELVSVAFFALRSTWVGRLRLGLRTDARDAINRLLLLLSVERRLSLVVPELPSSLTPVHGLELSRGPRGNCLSGWRLA